MAIRRESAQRAKAQHGRHQFAERPDCDRVRGNFSSGLARILGSVWVDIDAKNGYLPDHDDALEITFEGNGAALPEIQSRSRLLGAVW